MAMGLPCVATDVGDAALLLGDAGVVVPREDLTALVRGPEKLLVLAPAERLSLGQNARKALQEEFTLERTRERFEDVYNKVLKRRVYLCAVL